MLDMNSSIGRSPIINGVNPQDLSATACSSPDPHTLATMLQERLDAINNEIRLIQEQKEHAERAAEHLEQQAWMGDNLGGMIPYSDSYIDNAEQAILSGAGYSTGTHRTSPRNLPQYDFLMAKYNNVR